MHCICNSCNATPYSSCDSSNRLPITCWQMLQQLEAVTCSSSSYSPNSARLHWAPPHAGSHRRPLQQLLRHVHLPRPQGHLQAQAAGQGARLACGLCQTSRAVLSDTVKKKAVCSLNAWLQDRLHGKCGGAGGSLHAQQGSGAKLLSQLQQAQQAVRTSSQDRVRMRSSEALAHVPRGRCTWKILQ